MPRVRIIPFSPDRFEVRSSEEDLVAHLGWDKEDGQQLVHHVWQRPRYHPPVATGAGTPETMLIALMEAAPGHEPVTSSEETLDLAEAIQTALDTLLNERERYIVEALWFEGLSRRQLAERIPWSKSQIDRLEKSARRKLAQDPLLSSIWSQR